MTLCGVILFLFINTENKYKQKHYNKSAVIYIVNLHNIR